MGMIDNLSQSQIPEIFRRLRALENASPMNNGAVGRGGFEVYDGGVINISNGGLNVTGTATISGTLSVGGTTQLTGPFSQSGTSTFTGTTNLNGPTNVAGNFTATGDTKLNGPTHVNGNTDVTGTFTVNGAMRTTSTLSVEGVTTLKNDLNVTTGKINVGSLLVLDPGTSGGALRFTSGRVIRDTGSSLIIDNGAGSATVSVTSSHVLLEAGTAQVDVVGNVVGITGDLEATGNVYMNLPTTSLPGNLRIDPTSGQLFRSIA